MPTVSLQAAMGTTPSSTAPTGISPTGSKMRTPEEVNGIIQQMQKAADFSTDPATMDQMKTDLANGADINMPGLVDPATSQAHGVKKVSLSEAFGGDVKQEPRFNLMGKVKGSVEDLFNENILPALQAGGKIADYIKSPAVDTIPGRPLTDQEKEAALMTGNGPSPLDYFFGTSSGPMDQPDLGPQAKTLPAGYGQPTPEDIANSHKAGFLDNLKSPAKSIIDDSLPTNIIKSFVNAPFQNKLKADQISDFLKNRQTLDNPDKATPDQLKASKEYFDDLKKNIPKDMHGQFDDMVSSIKTDPGKFVATLINGLTADPEMIIIPGASARGIGAGVDAAGAAAKLGRVAARAGIAGTEGGAINAAIDYAHQSATGTGGINPDELKMAVATGAAFGGTLGAVLHNGVKAKVADLNAAKLNGTLKDILKDQGAYDATIEAAVKGDPAIPSDAKQRINDMLGITNKTDKEAFLKARRADVKDAFKTQGEYADYLEFKANEAADLHDRYQEQQANITQRHADEQAKQSEVEQAYSQTVEERRAQYQKDYENAVKQKEQTDLTDTHGQALAEDNMRTAQDKIDSEDALLAAHSDDLPAVKQAMAKIQRRNPSWKQRGAVDPELLARFGITAAGAAGGAYLAGPDHRAAGGLVGALAGLFVPAGGEIGRGIGGRERGVIGGKGAATAHLGRLEAAQNMEAMGKDSVAEPAQMKKDIYYQTGWYRGTDGNWKFEIPDTEAHIKGNVVRRIKDGGSTQIKNVLDHPELWKAYPKVGEIEVRFADMPKTSKGHYDPSKKEIVLNSKPEAYTGSGKVGSLPSIMLHEINHIIQYSEGHARGGSVDEFLAKIPEYKELKQKLAEATPDKVSNSEYIQLQDKLHEVKMTAYAQYRSLAGEVESRNVQTRYAMNENHRQRTMPETTEDTPLHQQVVRFGKQQMLSEEVPTDKSVADHLADSGHLTPDSTLRGVVLKENKLLNESEVISRAQKGDQKAYTALYKQYFPRLERSVRSFMHSARNKTNIDAQDIAQQAFIQAFHNINKFHGNSEFYTWLYRIAQNEGLQALRAGDSRIKTTSMFNDLNDQGAGSARAGHITEGDSSPVKGSVEIASATHDTPEAMARASEVQHQLEYAFSKLHDVQRKLVSGVDLEGKAPEDVAKELNIPYDTARKYLQRGREAIATSLEKGLGAVSRIDNSKHINTKISDASGNPIPMYHGTPDASFDKFENRAGKNSDHPSAGLGTFFSRDKAVAKDYETWNGESNKKGTIPVLLNIKNPKHFNTIDDFYNWSRDHLEYQGAAKAKQELIKHGYDGITVGNHEEVVAFSPEQIVRIDKAKLKKQSGSIDPDLLKKLAIGGAGAATGAYINKKHPLWGAALGAGAFLLLGKGSRDIWKDADYTAGIMSTRIKNKSEAIHKRAKDYYLVRNTVTHDLINAGHPFLSRVHKLPTAIGDVIQRSILSGNRVVTDKLLDAVGDPELIGSWKLIKKVIDGLGTELSDAGMIKKTVEDYFPRIVQDKEGLFKAMGKEQGDAVKQLLDQANRESLRSSGNPLSQADESEVINKAIAAFLYSKAPDSVRAGYTHGRRFKEIPEEYQKYYANLAESFHSYVRTAVKNIEMAKFFGKDLINKEEGGVTFPDIDKSIGKYVEAELRSGKITTDDVAEVSKMLRSSFVNFEKGGNKTIQSAKNITMAGYLGNPLSAAMQITTPIVTTYLQGIKPTIEATVKKLTGKSEVNAKDFGLADHMSEEFVGTTKSAKFLREALKWGSFKFSDLFDKDIKLNAAIIKARDLAKSPKGLTKLEDKYGQAFGDQFPALVKELKAKQVGQHTRSLAYMELSRSDPIDPLEFSQFYADNPNGRNLLALKSYMMKQVDLIRRDAYDEIKAGDRAKGIKNLAALSLVLGLSGMAGQDLQGVMLGRPIKFRLSDIPLNMLKTFGWSEYASRKATGSAIPTQKNPTGTSKAKAQLFQTVGEALAPPIPYQALDDLWNRDPRAVAMIPVVGRFLAEYYKNKNMTKAERTKKAQQL